MIHDHQLPPAVRATEGGRNPNGGFRSALATLQRIDDRELRQARLSNDAGLGATGGMEDFFTNTHALNGNHCNYRVNTKNHFEGNSNGYPLGMSQQTRDRWPQRIRFRELVDAWIAKNCAGLKATQAREMLSKELGMSSKDVLKQHYSGKNVPGKESIKRMCVVLGCRLVDLMGDDSSNDLAIPQEEWSESSEKARVIASAMFQDLKALPEDKQEILYQLWKQAHAIGKASLEAEGKPKP